METILLVDDNPLRAAMRRSLLENSAPALVRAMDGTEALCLVESPEFTQGLALVISGHVMSGLSGPEFAAELRSRVPHVPMLVLSSIEHADEAYDGIPGVYYSETKSPEELRTIVDRLLHARERRTA